MSTAKTIAEFPDMLRLWDYEKNKLDPQNTSIYVKDHVFWKCPKCKKEWESKALSRYKSRGTCPFCEEFKYIVKGVNDAFTVAPFLKKYFDWDNNSGIDPYTLSPISSQEINSKCDICGKKGKDPIRDRISIGDICPYHVLSDKITPHVNDAATIQPKLLSWFSTEDNSGTDPYTLSIMSSNPVTWHCPTCSGKWDSTVISRMREIDKCPVHDLNRIVITGINDLFTTNPETAAWYDWDKNSNIDIYHLAANSETPVNWKCDTCGATWQRSIESWVDSPQKCPCHDLGLLVIPGINDVFTTAPQLKKWYDWEANRDFDIYHETKSSKEEVWWRCPICHAKWSERICKQAGSADKCPCHETNRIIIKGINDLFTLCPEAKNIYDFDNNSDIDPFSLSPKSKDIINWHCPKCGYKWSASVYVRFQSKFKCPCCDNNKVIRRGVNDVLTLVPELKEEYDFDAHDFFDIFTEGISSHARASWHCRICGRKWKASIRSRVYKVDLKYEAHLCPHFNTTKRKKEEIPFVSEVPSLMKFWDFDKNNIDPSKTLSSTNIPAHWRCPNCGYAWITDIRAQGRGTGKCRCCELRQVAVKGINDLFTLLPEAASDIIPEENKGINLDTITVKSSIPLNWTCHICGHKFSAPPFRRITGTYPNYTYKQCGQCYINSLRGVKVPVISIPRLMKFWDYEKNDSINLDPNLTSAHSPDYAFWKCKDCGYEWRGTIVARYYADDECLCCKKNRKAVRGFNDVLTLVPDLANIFDWENNPEIDIYTCGVNSKEEVNWKCKKCGRCWHSPIYERIVKQPDGSYRVCGCSNCDSLVKRKLTYAEEYPELDKIHNDELSGHTLAEVKGKDSSNTKEWWNCPDCHRSFPSRVQSMISAYRKGNTGCPFCSHTALAEGQSFADLHPDLMLEYAPENEINPFEVFPFSKTSARWICKNNPEHKWDASFAERSLGIRNCPLCNSRSQVVLDINSFAAIYPERLSEWSPNNTCSPYDTHYKTNKWLKWICPTCRNEYGANMQDFLSEEESCPYCANIRIDPVRNSLKALYPEIAVNWSQNNSVSPDRVFPTWKKPVLWNCPQCHGEYSAPINEVVEGNYECPYCTGKRALPGFNSLKVLYPDIASMFSDQNELSSDEVLPGSGRQFIWNCPDCGGSFWAYMADIITGNYRCSYCDNRRVLPGFNSLKALYPDIAIYYSPENEKSADEVLTTNSVPHYWICPDCGGTYLAPMSKIIAGEDSCPFCEGKKPLPGYNTFAIKHPNLLSEWDFLNNYVLADPDNILDTCTTSVWWICSSNMSHRYSMSPSDRLLFEKRHKEPCLFCKGRRRKKRHY